MTEIAINTDVGEGFGAWRSTDDEALLKLVSAAKLAAERAVRMVIEGKVTAVTGEDVELSPAVLCVHSDTAGAVALTTAVTAALRAANIGLAPIA